MQMTSYFNPLSVQLPEKLGFRQPHTWKAWFTRIITKLNHHSQETQINTFLYAMRGEGEDILSSLKLTEEQSGSYQDVTAAFEKHFAPRVNVIYERVKFNRRCQEPYESVDAFITDLHNMADRCQYGQLREELISDPLVVGLANVQLLERQQLNADLTLEAAVTAARNSETVKQQQKDMRSQENSDMGVDDLRAPKKKGTCPNTKKEFNT